MPKKYKKSKKHYKKNRSHKSRKSHKKNKSHKHYDVARGLTDDLEKMEKGEVYGEQEVIPVKKSEMGPNPNTRERFDSLLEEERRRKNNKKTAHTLFSKPPSEVQYEMNEKEERSKMFREDKDKNPLDDDKMEDWGYGKGGKSHKKSHKK
jgi:metal-dependent hydrolase (beta-lactamase superfamily II)